MEEKLIKLLSENSIEIIIKYHIPYLCVGSKKNCSVLDEISIGDKNITGYNLSNKENISQELINKLKIAMIEAIKNGNRNPK